MGYKYDRLAERFLKDFNLPFKYIDFDHFKYCLNIADYTEEWLMLEHVIETEYKGNPELFLDEYYQLRNQIIEDIEKHKDYQWFNNTMNLNEFALPEGDRNIPQINIYNQDNVGKQFLSIDLKQANFQVLKHISSSIVKNTDTYEDFIGTYSDNDYIKDSKYTRQVIFGKLNPKRQITAAKYFTNEIRKTIKEMTDGENLKLISICNDEIIYEITPESHITSSFLELLKTCIKKLSGFDTKIEAFELKGYSLVSTITEKKKFDYYEKTDLFSHIATFKGIPQPFYKIVYKLHMGYSLDDMDYIFDYEGTKASFQEEFSIKTI